MCLCVCVCRIRHCRKGHNWLAGDSFRGLGVTSGQAQGTRVSVTKRASKPPAIVVASAGETNSNLSRAEIWRSLIFCLLKPSARVGPNGVSWAKAER